MLSWCYSVFAVQVVKTDRIRRNVPWGKKMRNVAMRLAVTNRRTSEAGKMV